MLQLVVVIGLTSNQHSYPYVSASMKCTPDEHVLCTCKAWKEAVDTIPPCCWRAAAAAVLPQPCITCNTRAEALVLLERYATAKHAIQHHLEEAQDEGLMRLVRTWVHANKGASVHHACPY